jgi:hypothetical protein
LAGESCRHPRAEFKGDEMTYREQFDSAMKCQTREEADAWMAKEVARYWTEHKVEAEKAHETILVNLGYMAGYYDDATAKKVHDLFGAKHPIFGMPGYHTNVPAEAAVKIGMKMGEAAKDDR